jgi:hypothetical protein
MTLYIITHIYIYILKEWPPSKKLFEISLFCKFSPKGTTNFRKFATKDKMKKLLIKGWGRILNIYFIQ